MEPFKVLTIRFLGGYREGAFTTEAQSSQSSEYFLINNSLLCALRASALKIVADPSFGGSAVQSPSPTSQESLKIQVNMQRPKSIEFNKKVIPGFL
jgi:hypothetical protein